MKIWHIGASPSPQTVDGINTTIWLVAKEQALMGHEVTLLLVSPPDENAKRVAEEFNFQLIYIPTNSWSYDLKKLDPILRSSPPAYCTYAFSIPSQSGYTSTLSKME